MENFNREEAKILNRIQQDINLTINPFKDLAKELDIDYDSFLNTVKKLKDQKIIRDISAIFNADRLGHRSNLITFLVSEKDIESAVEIINNHPGVSHNYLRDHKYNLWFTLTLENNISFEEEITNLAKQCRASDYLILENEKLLKIGLMLPIGDDYDDSINGQTYIGKKHNNSDINTITEEMKKAIFLLQIDLPIIDRPFRKLIDKHNIAITEDDVVKLGNELKSSYIMRRYSAVLKHQNAGYDANAMTAWKIKYNEKNMVKLKLFSENPSISHLYYRKLYPGKWEHPLFAMIHARDENELNSIIGKLKEESGTNDFLVLRTLKEFKKQRVKYFLQHIN